MNYNKLISNEDFERLVTDILYADLESGNKNFFRIAYKKLGIDFKRIKIARKRYPKFSSKAVNAVYEDILNIVIEEVCRKGNEELYVELIDFYIKRFPYLRDKFEECRNDIYRWKSLYLTVYKRKENNLSNFIHRSFILLYCITYGQSELVTKFFELGHKEFDYKSHYKGMMYQFYDLRNNIVERGKWLEDFYDMSNIKNAKEFAIYKGVILAELAEYLDVSIEYLDMNILRILVYYVTTIRFNMTGPNCYCKRELEGINTICRKYQMNQILTFFSDGQEYRNISREIFDQMCIEQWYYVSDESNESNDYTGEKNDMVFLDEMDLFSPEAFMKEFALRFLFECHLKSQKELYDEYYKSFSIDSSETDMEKLCKENNRLKDELERCRNKLQQYADADAERRKQQNKEAKKENRQYNEKIVSLQKQLDEQKKALEKQARTMEDMKEYIALVESANNIEPDSEMVDILKIYQHRILFVGGRQETVTKLKSVFSTANFVANETMQIPQKTDTVVLMAENMNHALYYKYIGHAREKGIKVIYCNGTNIESITNQVACNL